MKKLPLPPKSIARCDGLPAARLPNLSYVFSRLLPPPSSSATATSINLHNRNTPQHRADRRQQRLESWTDCSGWRRGLTDGWRRKLTATAEDAGSRRDGSGWTVEKFGRYSLLLVSSRWSIAN
nr:hypothetical protein Iba_chr02aCG9900 [Ipomoea batatas]